jgi:hypothetical protein
MSWLFDGEREINLGLERGQSFGLSKDQYGALANLCMGALRMAGVEPSEIRFLHDEEGEIVPGCDVILYGKSFVYTVRMQPQRGRSSLYALPLDSKLGGSGVELYTHEFKQTDYVGGILATILSHEGVQFMTLGELEEWNRMHNETGWL